MNRREFTASLGAMFAIPAVPLSGASVATPTVAVPPATYMWADLIARSRGTVDAGFLARRLGLSTAQSNTVMSQLVTDGVVQAPGVGGFAKAVQPVRFDLPMAKPIRPALTEVKERVQRAFQEQPVCDETPAPDKFQSFEDSDQSLSFGSTSRHGSSKPQGDDHASPNQSLQTRTQER